jgi:hypothetical protein
MRSILRDDEEGDIQNAGPFQPVVCAPDEQKRFDQANEVAKSDRCLAVLGDDECAGLNNPFCQEVRNAMVAGPLVDIVH